LTEYRRKRERIERDMAILMTCGPKQKKAKIDPRLQDSSKLSFNWEESSEHFEPLGTEILTEVDPTLSFKKRRSNGIRKTSFITNDSQVITEKHETIPVKLKFGKDPSIDTSFLPDRDRDKLKQEEEELRNLAWLERQEQVKVEPLQIDYCYYDGTSHQKTFTVQKGDTIRYFIDEGRLPFPELKGITSDHIIFVKQNIIIPPSYTFYELIMEDKDIKGPLSTWTLSELDRKPLQMQVGQMMSLAKIVIREFYEKNKHLFPYKDWINYDDYVSEKRKQTILTENESKATF